ncbi:unnamed protein product [Schistosoma turkestanicum]|nr:unnamed protein product [Schistosoma turkestanicum]
MFFISLFYVNVFILLTHAVKQEDSVTSRIERLRNDMSGIRGLNDSTRFLEQQYKGFLDIVKLNDKRRHLLNHFNGLLIQYRIMKDLNDWITKKIATQGA